MGHWDGLAVLTQAFEVELDCLPNEPEHLVLCFAHGNTSGQIGNICPDRCLTLLKNHEVFHVVQSFFNSACFQMLPSVPTGMSTLIFPATVTVPGFVGCLNCR